MADFRCCRTVPPGVAALPGRWLVLVIWCLLLPACSTVPSAPGPQERAWALAGAGLLDEVPAVALPEPDQLMAADDAMLAVARRIAARGGSDEDRLGALITALSDPGDVGLRYDGTITLTASAAFHAGKVNCLSYSLLFVILAREVGLEPHFNEVDVPTIWDLGESGSYVLYKHINVWMRLRSGDSYVADVSASEYDPAFRSRLMSDREAWAQFYNNRAVEMRLQGELQAALWAQLRALSLDTSRAYLWVNLGSLYLAMGSPDAAWIAIREAEQLSGQPEGLYGTAAAVSEALGKPAQAQRYRRLALQYLQQNPYYHYQLALGLIGTGDDRAARRELEQAIALYHDEHRFHALLAQVLWRAGQHERALRSLNQAIALTRDDGRRQMYQRKRDRLQVSDAGPHLMSR